MSLKMMTGQPSRDYALAIDRIILQICVVERLPSTAGVISLSALSGLLPRLMVLTTLQVRLSRLVGGSLQRHRTPAR